MQRCFKRRFSLISLGQCPADNLLRVGTSSARIVPSQIGLRIGLEKSVRVNGLIAFSIHLHRDRIATEILRCAPVRTLGRRFPVRLLLILQSRLLRIGKPVSKSSERNGYFHRVTSYLRHNLDHLGAALICKRHACHPLITGVSSIVDELKTLELVIIVLYGGLVPLFCVNLIVNPLLLGDEGRIDAGQLTRLVIRYPVYLFRGSVVFHRRRELHDDAVIGIIGYAAVQRGIGRADIDFITRLLIMADYLALGVSCELRRLSSFTVSLARLNPFVQVT